MKLSDFNLLKKLMQLATSSNDHEALASLRKANALLTANGTDWEKVFGRLVSVEVEDMALDAEPRPAPDAPVDRARQERQRYVDGLFEEIEASDPRGSFADFVADVKRQWESNGRLSQAQLDAIVRGARNARERVR